MSFCVQFQNYIKKLRAMLLRNAKHYIFIGFKVTYNESLLCISV